MSDDNLEDQPKRPQFGNRFLPKSNDDAADNKAVFKHNAW